MAVDEEWLRLAEAMVFAAAAPVTARQLAQLLPDGVAAEAVLAGLAARYAGRGVELVEVAGGVQFRTAPDLAPRLRRVVIVPRRLPRVAMETLAIIAYHQPVTRGEIEDIRGAALAQATLDALLELALVAPRGRRRSPAARPCGAPRRPSWPSSACATWAACHGGRICWSSRDRWRRMPSLGRSTAPPDRRA